VGQDETGGRPPIMERVRARRERHRQRHRLYRIGFAALGFLVLAAGVVMLVTPGPGIPAIINATKVDPAWQMGNAAMAQKHSDKAKMFSMIATIIGAVGFVIYFIIGWRFGLSLFGSE